MNEFNVGIYIGDMYTLDVVLDYFNLKKEFVILEGCPVLLDEIHLLPTSYI